MAVPTPTALSPFVFIGDSITDVGRREDPDGFLGHGYVRMLRDRLEVERPGHEVINKGISGDRVVDLMARWQADVLDVKPGFLTVAVGINDTWRRYDSGHITTAADFEENYRTLLKASVNAGNTGLALIEPFVLPVTEGQLSWGEDLDDKRAIVASLAQEFGAAFIKLQDPMLAAGMEHGPEAIAPDGVHPTKFGHRIMADAWLKGVGL